MHRLVKEQLRNVKIADLGEWDDNTSHFLIRKYVPATLTIGHRYIIRLTDSVLSGKGMPDGSDWNGGSIPNSRFYSCTVVRTVGRMADIVGCPCRADGAACPSLPEWSGWIPEDGTDIIRELQ